MLKKIAKLEQLSRQLDPDASVRKNLFEQAGSYSESFLTQLPETKTYTRDDGRNGLNSSPIGEEPGEMSDLLELYRYEVDTTGILPASGGQLGYIPGGGLYPSALGDYLAGISNRYSGVAFAGPGAARMEHELVSWMCRLVGYPDSSADYSLELTRPFRGPRMWFPLKLFGLKPFRASLAEKIWLAP